MSENISWLGFFLLFSRKNLLYKYLPSCFCVKFHSKVSEMCTSPESAIPIYTIKWMKLFWKPAYSLQRLYLAPTPSLLSSYYSFSSLCAQVLSLHCLLHRCVAYFSGSTNAHTAVIFSFQLQHPWPELHNSWLLLSQPIARNFEQVSLYLIKGLSWHSSWSILSLVVQTESLINTRAS